MKNVNTRISRFKGQMKFWRDKFLPFELWTSNWSPWSINILSEKDQFSSFYPVTDRSINWGMKSKLTLSWRRCLSCRNQSIYLQSKSIDWFLYHGDLSHERVEEICSQSFLSNSLKLYCLGGRTNEKSLWVWSIVHQEIFFIIIGTGTRP